MKTISILLLTAFLSLSTIPFTGCANMGTTITSAQAWLNDPKNQALIQEIATTAISVIGFLGTREGANTHAAVVGKLSTKYPDVPAGALSQIASQPRKYAKAPQH